MHITNFFKFSLCSLSFFICENAFSWWDQSHQLIGGLAEKNVSDNTRNGVLELLNVSISFPGSSELSKNTKNFYTVASWADSIKDSTQDYSQCHYIDLYLDKKMIGTNVDEAFARRALTTALAENKQNSVSCLKGAIKTLTATSLNSQGSQDFSYSPLQRAIALRFVIHIIGDMAQPLHNASLTQNNIKDEGGNKTLFHDSILIPSTDGTASPQKKLHALWDSSLATFLQFPFNRETVKLGIFSKSDLELNEFLAAKLQAQNSSQEVFNQISESDNQSIEDWVIDSYGIAVRDVYTDLNQTWGAYSVPRQDIVTIQILKGSGRIANVLNAIFDPQNSTLAFQKLVYGIKNDPAITPLIVK